LIVTGAEGGKPGVLRWSGIGAMGPDPYGRKCAEFQRPPWEWGRRAYGNRRAKCSAPKRVGALDVEQGTFEDRLKGEDATERDAHAPHAQLHNPTELE
jgi:hypothetical protein